MPAGYAFAGHIGLAKETSGGTDVSETDSEEALSENLKALFNRIDVKNIHGKFSETDDVKGLERIGGTIVIPGNARDIGYFLNGVMGIQSNTVVLSGFLHHHEFTL